MASTPIFPYAVWSSGTNQNSIPANDNSLRNQILNGTVISQAVTAQPGSPADGDIYIINATHTGTAWATFTPKDLAIYRVVNSVGTWYAYAPVEGVVVNLAGTPYQYLSGAWVSVAGGIVNPMTTAGDIIIGGASGTPTRLAVGSTAGHVLTSNGSGAAPSYQAVSGGGGGVTGNLTLTDYAWVNQLAATATQTGTNIVMTGGTVASDSWNILKKSQSLTAPCRVQLTLQGNSFGTVAPSANQSMGLILRESSTGKFAVAMWNPQPVATASSGGGFTFTNQTTFLATVATFPSVYLKRSPYALTIRRSGSNWYFGWSFDGVYFYESAAQTIASFSPDEVGFGINNQGTTTNTAVMTAQRIDIT
jgi:hypothetical protein